jgi:hypothetical protein
MVDFAFSSAFSSAFDTLASDANPQPIDLCWPVDWTTCPPDFMETITAELQAIAESLAVQTLRTLTGYRVGGCAITVRPCKRRCAPGSWLVAPDAGMNWAGAVGAGSWGWTPYVGSDGLWLNACGCRNDDCSCVEVREVVLPGPVGRVDSVILDGVTLPVTSYRVDNGDRLVRTDGEDWPVCQDMNLEEGEDTFFVTYLKGNPVDTVGSYVAGLLAAEYARACLGQNCALPSNVTNIARQGITMDLDAEMFANGMTGIKAVDSWIRIWNPLDRLPSGIYSVDAGRPRQTTWRY